MENIKKILLKEQDDIQFVKGNEEEVVGFETGGLTPIVQPEQEEEKIPVASASKLANGLALWNNRTHKHKYDNKKIVLFINEGFTEEELLKKVDQIENIWKYHLPNKSERIQKAIIDLKNAVVETTRQDIIEYMLASKTFEYQIITGNNYEEIYNMFERFNKKYEIEMLEKHKDEISLLAGRFVYVTYGNSEKKMIRNSTIIIHKTNDEFDEFQYAFQALKEISGNKTLKYFNYDTESHKNNANTKLQKFGVQLADIISYDQYKKEHEKIQKKYIYDKKSIIETKTDFLIQINNELKSLKKYIPTKNFETEIILINIKNNKHIKIFKRSIYHILDEIFKKYYFKDITSKSHSEEIYEKFKTGIETAIVKNENILDYCINFSNTETPNEKLYYGLDYNDLEQKLKTLHINEEQQNEINKLINVFK